MVGILQSLCRVIYEYIYSLFWGQVLSFPGSRITVTLSSASARQIGEGAFSVVLKVKDINDGKSYAVKKMLLQSAENVSMANLEVDSLKRFHHPHIIRLLDVVTCGEGNHNLRVMYLLLPYYHRGNLRDALNLVLNKAAQRPPITAILRDFRSICEAVKVLHHYQPSYIHQDIKPENILIDDFGKPILTDFGSVRKAFQKIETRNDILRVTDEAAQFCTASYRSPELFDPPKGIHLDTRTDVWSLGCLLYAWWFGYSPFESQFVGEKIKVVPCSVLRVLSRISWKSNPAAEDTLILELCEWILEKEITKRPFVTDVIDRIDIVLDQLNGGHRGNMV
jgi:serine/threonine kinase 16